MRPPGSVYLALLVSRLPKTWASRVRSASRKTGSGGSETVSSCPAASISGRAVSTALLTHVRQQHAGPAQLHLVAVDAGDVEQVVDQPHHVPELPLHHGPGLGDGVGVAGREPHHLQAVAERGQRVAQLVGQQGEELVLPPVLLPQGVLHPPPFRDVGAGGGHEQDAARLVRHGGEDEVHHPLGPVGHEVVGLRAEHARPPAAWRRGRPDHVHQGRRAVPPAALPERLADDLVAGEPAGVEAEPVRLDDRAVEGQDAGEVRPLLEEGPELGVRLRRPVPPPRPPAGSAPRSPAGPPRPASAR